MYSRENSRSLGFRVDNVDDVDDNNDVATFNTQVAKLCVTR